MATDKTLKPTASEDFPVEVKNLTTDMEESGFWMRPLVKLEERLMYQEEVRTTKLRTVGWSYQRDLTPEFFADLEQALTHNQQFSCATTAKPGAGKTSIMLALASHTQLLFKELKIHNENEPTEIKTSIGRNDTMETLKSLSSNMIFFQDEDPFVSGIDSQSSEQALQNVLEIVLRFNRIPYFDAAVTKKRGMIKNFYSCYLEPLSWNETKRKTFCRLYSGKTLLPLGHVIINILPADNWLQQAHNKKEEQYKQQMLENSGYESVSIRLEELQYRSKKLLFKLIELEYLDIETLNANQKQLIKRLRVERLKTAMRQLAYQMPGSSDKHNRVIDYTWDQIQTMKDKIDAEAEIRKNQEKKQREQHKLEFNEKKAKQLQQQEESTRQEQMTLIEELLPITIDYFGSALDNKLPTRLLRHYYKKKGITTKFLNYALGELEEHLFLLEMDKGDDSDKSEEIQKYQVNLEADRFEFSDKDFLDQLRRTSGENTRQKPWSLLVDVYRDKLNGLYYEKIAANHGIAEGSVTNYTRKVAGKIAEEMGQQYELFRVAKLREQYPDAKISVSKQYANDPDIILDVGSEIQYHSLKVYRIPSAKGTKVLNLLKKFNPEYKAALYSNEKMFIDYYNVAHHTHTVTEVDISRVTEQTRVRLKYTGEMVLLYD